MVDLPSKTWCAFPWMQIVTHNNGTYGPCCRALEYVAAANDDASDGMNTLVGDMFEDEEQPIEPYGLTIEEAYASPFMQNIRDQMMKGEKPTACRFCWEQERTDPHGKGRRTGSNELYLGTVIPFKGIFDNSSVNLIQNPMVRSLDLKFTNKCNLTCLMCSSGSSDKWMEMDKRIDAFLTEENVSTKDRDLYHSGAHNPSSHSRYTDRLPIWDDPTNSFSNFPDEMFEEVLSLVPQLEEIQITGGEPFMSEQFIKLLNYAIDTGHANHIALEVTTNGTKFIPDVMKLLSHFKHLRFIISIDGTGKTYEYIRPPYTWKLLCNRMETLNEFIKDWPPEAEPYTHLKPFVNIAIVGTAYNLFDITNIHTELSLNDRDADYNPYIHNHDSPLQIKWLPDYLLDKAIELYNDQSTWIGIPSNGEDLIYHMPVCAETLLLYIKENPVDNETKLYHQRRLKNFTVLMDKMLDRKYCDYLHPDLVTFLDSVECDL